jgi:hypothetical protein
MAPLYRWLQQESPGKATVKWNFHKFLIDGDGNVIGSFASKVTPEDPKLVAAIETALGGGTASKASKPKFELLAVAFDGMKLPDGSTFSVEAEEAKRISAQKAGTPYAPPAGIEWRPDARDDLEKQAGGAAAPRGRFLVSETAPFTERDFDGFRPSMDRVGQRTLTAIVRKDRREAFEQFTSKWVNHALAIVVDGEIVTAPVVKDPMKEAVEISNPGGFTASQQERLVEALKQSK